MTQKPEDMTLAELLCKHSSERQGEAMNITAQQAIDTGKSMAEYFASVHGYDSTLFRAVEFSDFGVVTFCFNLEDNFQKKLNYNDRFHFGYQTISAESLDEAWTRVRKWPTRKVRELSVIITLTKHFRENYAELECSLLWEICSKFFASLDEAKELILPNPKS